MKYKIKNWEKFQHYKDRNPPWIKLATDTFQNYDFGCLHDASKLLAICIWTLASRSIGGEIPDDFDWIKRQCNLGDFVTLNNLKELIDHGLIYDASITLAVCKQNARPETEGEAEGETEKRQREKEKPLARKIFNGGKNEKPRTGSEAANNYIEKLFASANIVESAR